LPREYLFVAIDDHSRELYAGIFSDKTQYSAKLFLCLVADECPYTIEYTYSDNGKEFKRTSKPACLCQSMYGSGHWPEIHPHQARPQTNDKAERVIRTLMNMWHKQEIFKDRKNRQVSLLRFINYYNTVKLHKGIDNIDTLRKIARLFLRAKSVNNALTSNSYELLQGLLLLEWYISRWG
jgi:transposase InsO family protein